MAKNLYLPGLEKKNILAMNLKIFLFHTAKIDPCSLFGSDIGICVFQSQIMDNMKAKARQKPHFQTL